MRRLTGMVAGYGRRLTVPTGGMAEGREEVKEEKEREEEGNPGWVEEPEEMSLPFPSDHGGEPHAPTPTSAPRPHPRLNILRRSSASPPSFSSLSSSSSIDSVDYAQSLIEDFFLASLYKPLPLGAGRKMGGLWEGEGGLGGVKGGVEDGVRGRRVPTLDCA